MCREMPREPKRDVHPLSLGWVRRRGPGGARRRANRAVTGSSAQSKIFWQANPSLCSFMTMTEVRFEANWPSFLKRGE